METIYPLFLDNITDLMIHFESSDKKITWVNQAVADYLNLPKNQIIGSFCYKILCQDDQNCENCPVIKAFESKKPEDLEILMPNGRYWMHRAFPVTNQNGEMIGVLKLIRDITEKKLIEQKLQAEGDLFKILMDGLTHAQIGIDIIGIDFKVLFQNQLLKDRFSDLTGKICYKNYMGREEPCDFCPMTRVIERGSLERQELTALDGKNYELFCAPLPHPDSTIDKVAHVVIDVTPFKEVTQALRLSEEKYRNIIENVNDPVIIIGLDGNLHYVAPQLSQILGGIEVGNDVTSVMKLIHPDDVTVLWDDLQRAFQDKSIREGEESEFRMRHKDSHYLWFRTSTKNHFDSEGKVTGFITVLRNITERMQMEMDLRQSEAKYHDLYSRAPVAYFSVRIDGVIVNANKAAENLLGYKLEKLRGMKLFDLYAEKSKAKAKQLLEQFRVGIPWESEEMVYQRNDGTDIYGLLSVNPIKNEIGEVIESRSVVVDITQRKQAEQALRESELKYSTVVENTKDGILILHNGLYKFANKGMAEMSGYSAEELINMPFLNLVAPEDRDLLTKRYQLRMAGGDVPQVYETKMLCKDGTIKNMDVITKVIQFEGEPAVLGTIHDITERKLEADLIKKERDKVQTYLDIAGVMLLVIGRDQTIQLINKKGCEILDAEEADLIGKNWFDNFLRKEEISEVKAVFNELMAGNIAPVEYYENSAITNSGKEKIIAWHNTVLKDETGELIGTLSSGEDITERKRALQQLKDSEEKFAKSFHAAPILMAITRQPDGFIIDVNNKFIEILGYKREELLGRTTLELDLWVDPKQRQKFLNTLQENNYVRDVELKVRTKSGDIRWVLFSGEVIKMGEKPYLITIANDITEAKLAEDALRESEARFRSFTENAPDFVMQLGHDGTIQFINRTHEGLNPESVVGSLVFSWIPEDYIPTFKRALSQVFETAQARVVEHAAWDAQMKMRWYSSHLGPIGELGNVTSTIVVARDITKRKLAEQQLKVSEEKYSTLVEQAQVGVVIIQDFIFQFSNKAFSEMTSYSIEELMDMSFWKISPPELHEIGRERMNLILNNKIYTPFETTIKSKDDRIIDIEVSARRIIFKGRPAVLGTIHDITDRKQAALKLKESEEKYRMLFEGANDGICLLDPYAVIDTNEYILNMFGYDEKQEVIGLEPWEVSPLNQPDGRNSKEKVRGLIDKCLEGKPQRFYWTHRRKDGSLFDTEVSLNRILLENKYFTQAIVRDITERKEAELKLKESEEKYRLITENANDMLAVINESFEYEYINEPFTKILGYFSEEFIGKNRIDILHPDDLDAVRKAMKILFDKYEVLLEVRLRKKNGQYIWTEIYGKTFLDTEGTRKALLVGRDITERKALEEAQQNYTQKLENEVNTKTKELQNETTQLQKTLTDLKAAQEQLIQSEKLASIGLLAAGIAHEINNPLMGIINYAQIINDELVKNESIDLSVKPYSFIEKITKEGERIAEIVRGLLSFAREDRGEFVFVDVSEIINSAVSLLIPKIKNSQIDLELKYDEKTPKIPVQPRNIRQVFLNVLQNSIAALNEKFEASEKTHQKKIVVKTSVLSRENKDYTMIEITDNGQGIKPEHLPQIFDPFFSTKEKSKDGGIGLGLSISYGIIKDHNGTIDIQSKWNQGTTVEILFPLKKE